MNYLLLTAALVCLSSSTLFGQKTETVSQKQAHSFLSGKPILFQENKGQITDVKGKQVPSVLFKTSTAGIDAYITTKGLVYVFSKKEEVNLLESLATTDPHKILESEAASSTEMEWLQVHLEGADIRTENVVKERAGVTDHRFFFSHCPDGIKGVKEYEKITIREVYPGIDWVLYGSSKTGMKYDFIVHPGADPSRIKLLYEGEHPVEIDAEGNIQVQMRFGKLTENAPVSFFGEAKNGVGSSFKKEAIDQYNVRISYQIGSYPKDQTLIIDPQLVWGTRFGGDGFDVMHGITHDSNGNIFIVGETKATVFPVLDAGTYFQASFTGGNKSPFILKFSNSGVLLWSTLYGRCMDSITQYVSTSAIACDGNDNVFIAMRVDSLIMPVQDAGTYFDNSWGGGANNAGQPYADVFLLKFDNAGNRLWATYYGSSHIDVPQSVSCDANGNFFVTGITYSANFPLQNSGTYFQTPSGYSDVFILKFDNMGNRLWATCYRGTSSDRSSSISCDANGNIFITGNTSSTDFPVQNSGTYFDGTLAGDYDVFILKFDNLGNRLWATYCGGLLYDMPTAIECDANGNVFVAGYTLSNDFPLQNSGTYFDGTLGGIDDAFILKFDNTGNRLWGTYYGGSDREGWTPMTMPTFTSKNNIAFDKCSNVYISLQTYSADVQTLDPGNGGYFDNSYGQITDIFLTRFTNDGALTLATYLGPNSTNGFESIEMDNNDNLFLMGALWSTNSPLLTDPGNGAYFDTTADMIDGYILKFIPDTTSISYTTNQTPAGCNCSGTATVNVMGGTGPYTYNWSNGAQTANTNSPTNTATGICAGNLWVEVSSCSDTDTLFFNFLPGVPPTVTFTVDDTTVCVGTCSTFNQNNINLITAWNFGDGTTSSLGNPVHCYQNPGNYTVSLTLSDNLGCTATQTMNNYIKVTASPKAAFNANPWVTTLSNPTIQFTEMATGEISWNWNFGDAVPGTSNAQNPSYTYTQAGRYNVSLVVTNAAQCTDTARLAVSIYEDPAFYVPNTFSPNGDGINDQWSPQEMGIDPERYQIQVFNRWGELIWQTTDLTDDWNGTFNGKKAPDGTYTWTATFSVRGVPQIVSGSVTLIR